MAQGLQQDRLVANLERLASELSVALSDNRSRGLLLKPLLTSKNKIVPLGALLSNAMRGDQNEDMSGVERLARLVKLAQEIEAGTNGAGAPVPRLALMAPVSAHHELFGSSTTILVAVPPAGEEEDATSVTAFDNGRRVTLSTDEPPKMPTLVVLPVETEGFDPSYPLVVATQSWLTAVGRSRRARFG